MASTSPTKGDKMLVQKTTTPSTTDNNDSDYFSCKFYLYMAAKKHRLMPDLDELECKRKQTKSVMNGVEAAVKHKSDEYYVELSIGSVHCYGLYCCMAFNLYSG